MSRMKRFTLMSTKDMYGAWHYIAYIVQHYEYTYYEGRRQNSSNVYWALN
jgi:hypothetical protein